jgi:hypothetical protein
MFVDAVKHVCEESGIKILGWDSTGAPVFNKNEIRFNGGCETFAIERVRSKYDIEKMKRWGDKEHFSFCKTNRAKYDILVKACMLLHKYFFPEINISCDGPMSEFDPAKELVETITGLELPELKEEVEA